MNNNDPYSEFLSIMKEMGGKNNPPAILIGKVSNPSPELRIMFSNIEIDKDNLLIADYLLKDYEREIEVEGTGQVSGKINFTASSANGTGTVTLSGSPVADTFAVINSDSNIVNANIEIKKNAKLKFTNTLKKDDLVAVMPTYDRQTFIVLCRVVRI